MNQKNYANIILVAIIIILLGMVGYFVLVRKSETPSVIQTPSNSSVSAPSISPENHTISLKTIPIAFELPKDYAIFQREGFEGGYATTISVGKEISSGYLKYAPLQIELFFYVYDAQRERTYQPSDYIDVVFGEQEKNYAANPKYVQLFGNKAVRYTNDADSSPIIIGYLRADQIPNLSKEYLIRITSGTYGAGVGFNKELFDTVINSLRISK